MSLSKFAIAAALWVAPAVSSASVVYWGNIGLTTNPNANGAEYDGTGVWFNPFTGYAESRGYYFPNPLFEDGKFLLVMDTYYAQTEAEVWTEGYFSDGNHVIGDANGNPLRLTAGAAINASTGSEAEYVDLGPTYGNWAAGGEGYIPLVLGSTTGSIYYGYADVTVDPSTYAITLNAFAYESTPGATIVAGAVPEPTSMAPLAVAGLLFVGRRRRD
jgi:hypothetical protein